MGWPASILRTPLLLAMLVCGLAFAVVGGGDVDEPALLEAESEPPLPEEDGKRDGEGKPKEVRLACWKLAPASVPSALGSLAYDSAASRGSDFSARLFRPPRSLVV